MSRQVPNSPRRTRIKYVARVVMGQSPPSSEYTEFDGSAMPFLQGNAEFGEVSPNPKLACSTAPKRCEVGDYLLSVRAPVGQLNLADRSYGIGRGLCAIRFAESRCHSGFGRYVLECLHDDLQAVSVGTTYSAVTVDDVRSMAVELPDSRAQGTITRFLDRKTAAIDALIEKKKRLIELLQEKRQALITQAVTKGLDPDVPMKDSGVEWIGEIPAHWEVRRLGSIFREASEPGRADLPILSVSIHTGVSDSEIPDEELDRKVSRSEDRSKYKCVRPQDLVYNMMRAWQGGFGTVEVVGQVSPAYVVLRPLARTTTKYFEQLLRTPSAIENMRRLSHGVTDFRLRLYWSVFKTVSVSIPPDDEIEAIGALVDQAARKTESLCSRIRDSIALLLEKRQALITAAVTGQIEIPEEEPATP